MAGGLSVVVSVLGDVTDLQDKLGKAINSSKTFGEKFSAASKVVGGAMTAAGGFVEHFGSQMEDAHIQLEQAITNTGGNFKELAGQVEGSVKRMETFGHTSADTQEALAKLTTRLNDPQKALADMSVVAEVAAVKHMSLADAADVVGKAAQGNAKVLKQFGIDAKDAADPVGALGQKLKGVAEGQADTFHGHMEAIRAKVTDVAGTIGEKVGPALVMLGPALAGLGPAMNIAKSAAAGASGAFEALGGAMDVLAANPIVLVIAGVAALAVGLYEAYKHVGWFHDIVDKVFGWIGGFISGAMGVVTGAIQGVWNWVHDNWPLLLGIITGPIGLAVALIITHWDTVKNGFTAVKDWIGDRIGDIVGFITGIPGRIGGAASTAWDGLKTSFTGVKNWIGDRIGDIVGFITGMPTRISTAAVGLFDGVRDAFKAAINWIIGAWDSLHFKVGGWTVGAGPISVTLPTVDMGLPHINPLAAGGVVTSPTLALVGEAGPEAVIPLGRGGGLGTTINATFNITGAVDKAGAAREIEQILTDFVRQGGNLRFTA